MFTSLQHYLNKTSQELFDHYRMAIIERILILILILSQSHSVDKEAKSGQMVKSLWLELGRTGFKTFTSTAH